MNVAIIAAAGQGTRLAGKRPKQFLELTGTPIIIHTLKTFERCEAIHEIITVVAAGEVDSFLSVASRHGVKRLSKVVAGGATRAESVLLGLEAADAERSEIVAVHDGVRPFVTVDEITRTIESAKLNGAAVLVAATVDTVKEVNDGTIVRTLDRARLRNALTPQCFRYELLKRAYEKVDLADPSLTDESSLVERLGERIAVVDGSSRNIKITTAEDLVIAEAMMRARGQ
jgi:2-C-methyl-D-erythritol 4-phosphate cytidylyltransferase